MKKMFSILILLSVLLCMSSCGMSTDPSDIRSKLKSAGYTAELISKRSQVEECLEFLDVDSNGVDSLIIAYDEEDGERENVLIVCFCDDKKSAQFVKSDFEFLLNNDTIFEEIAEDFEGMNELDYVAGQSGSVAYFGYNDMVEAIK